MIFDLWDTLVDFDVAAGRAFQDRVAERLGRDPDEFAALWLEGRAVRESGTLRNYLLGIGVEEDLVDELVDWRRSPLAGCSRRGRERSRRSRRFMLVATGSG